MYFCMISDDDGHHYIVPLHMKGSALEWLAKMETKLDGGELEHDNLAMPDYMKPIEDPKKLVFENWREI